VQPDVPWNIARDSGVGRGRDWTRIGYLPGSNREIGIRGIDSEEISRIRLEKPVGLALAVVPRGTPLSGTVFYWI
jgi:hypothetical protein